MPMERNDCTTCELMLRWSTDGETNQHADDTADRERDQHLGYEFHDSTTNSTATV